MRVHTQRFKCNSKECISFTYQALCKFLVDMKTIAFDNSENKSRATILDTLIKSTNGGNQQAQTVKVSVLDSKFISTDTILSALT